MKPWHEVWHIYTAHVELCSECRYGKPLGTWIDKSCRLERACAIGREISDRLMLAHYIEESGAARAISDLASTMGADDVVGPPREAHLDAAVRELRACVAAWDVARLVRLRDGRCCEADQLFLEIVARPSLVEGQPRKLRAPDRPVSPGYAVTRRQPEAPAVRLEAS
jgi:hypothetical protein